MERITAAQAAARLREEHERVVAERSAGLSLSCREGCAACCRQLVVVSPLEALAIAEHVAARPELAARAAERGGAWRAAVASRPELARRLERFDAAEGFVEPAEGGALEVAYWQAQLPCPFLEEECCSIYPVRPFACRELLVTSDPRLCALDPDAVTRAPTRLEFRAVASSVGETCFELPDRLIPLPECAVQGSGTEEAPPAERARFEAAFGRARRLVEAAMRLLGAGP